MKSLSFLTVLFALLLAACAPSTQNYQITPTIITVEVTRIVQITVTPAPKYSATPTPTLERIYAEATDISRRIGTPIVANDDCFQDSTLTQSGLNGCAAGRLDEMKTQMSTLLEKLKKRYELRPAEDWQRFLNFQAEWEDFSQRECAFTSGAEEINGVRKGGSMAPMNYAECLVGKYQDRLRELQGEIYIDG